jgi:hypothetical protein
MEKNTIVWIISKMLAMSLNGGRRRRRMSEAAPVNSPPVPTIPIPTPRTTQQDDNELVEETSFNDV